jgi:hypothetical protein
MDDDIIVTLKRSNDLLMTFGNDYSDVFLPAIDEIERLRKALERIADSSNWGEDGCWDADSYPNEIAEKALYPDEALKEKE